MFGGGQDVMAVLDECSDECLSTVIVGDGHDEVDVAREPRFTSH